MQNAKLGFKDWRFISNPCILLALAFSIQPFASKIDAETTLVDEVGAYKPENRRLTDATHLVAVLTPMPNVSAFSLKPKP